MSQKQGFFDESGESIEKLNRAMKVARDTVPGKSNSEIVSHLSGIDEITRSFVEELNNWIEIIDVRVYRDGSIGIPCRFRWTIKRWASVDMDRWLLDNGWELIHHRRADSYSHEPNEMEARYAKEIEGATVYANIYVEFTEDVFRAMNEDNHIEKAEKRNKKKDVAQAVREQKMEGR